MAAVPGTQETGQLERMSIPHIVLTVMPSLSVEIFT
jgi:hypothetical protein